MATEIIKSTAISNLDAVPPVRATAGQGAEYVVRKAHAVAHVTSGVTAAGASYYQMVRVPSNAIIKHIWMWLDASGTTITGDVGIYYSSSTNNDGTPKDKIGTVINVDHFASAVALAAIVLVPLDVTREAGTFLGADMDLPLWNTSASGLTEDPKCPFDICFTLTSTAGSAADLNMEVEYARPNT
jgi:hypothetical protein